MAGTLSVAATLAAWVTAGALEPGRILRSEPTPLAPGEAGELSVTILQPPEPGVPLDVRLTTDSPHVRLAAERLGWPDVVDPQARQPRVRVPFVAPRTPGRYPVSGLVTWVTCRDAHCRTHRAAVSWTLEVRDAAALSASSSPSPSTAGGARETTVP